MPGRRDLAAPPLVQGSEAQGVNPRRSDTSPDQTHAPHRVLYGPDRRVRRESSLCLAPGEDT